MCDVEFCYLSISYPIGGKGGGGVAYYFADESVNKFLKINRT